jgi:ribonuclease VapC
MVIDTSAIIAVLLNELNAARIAQAIEAGSPRLLSAANLLESSIVIESRKGEVGGRELDLLIYRAAMEVVAVDRICTPPKHAGFAVCADAAGLGN